ncbi:MAG: hypothetical protein KIT80_18325 [Chitinophagaceae bacterium]|nr:hypothetical protein [Chitinophagaceae bacterium]MCW5928882.1 hypothetical protein [Chitinophagaceae bacterium]
MINNVNHYRYSTMKRVMMGYLLFIAVTSIQSCGCKNNHSLQKVRLLEQGAIKFPVVVR